MNINKTIGEIVADDFRAAAIFKHAGIDFCCGGNKFFDQACAEVNVSKNEIEQKIAALEHTPPLAGTNYKDWDADFLCDYIVNTHHKNELEWLEQLKFYTAKIADVHGQHHPELIEIANLYLLAYEELTAHFKKEENVLFPAIRETVKNRSTMYKSLIMGAINQMNHEHVAAGGFFEEINKLSKGYTLPDDACNTYKVTFRMLQQLEDDLHVHIHLENNVLFDKALKLF